MNNLAISNAVIRSTKRHLLSAALLLPLMAVSQGDFWSDDDGTRSWGGNDSIGYSKTDSETRAKLYAKWIQTHQVRIDPDGSRVVVRHSHTEECKKRGYCYLQTDYVNVAVESTNRVGTLVSDTARVRLVRELDPERKSWIVEVIDATALPFQINPSAGSYDVNLIVVDFEEQEDFDLYDDRELNTPLNKKKETRRIQVVQNGMTITRKLPVFCDTREVLDFHVDTNVVVHTITKAVDTPIRYVKPTMQDFAKWVQDGHAVSFHMKFTDTCPRCKRKGRWTEWSGGGQQIVTCSQCNGTGSVWIEKDVTVKGP